MRGREGRRGGRRERGVARAGRGDYKWQDKMIILQDETETKTGMGGGVLTKKVGDPKGGRGIR